MIHYQSRIVARSRRQRIGNVVVISVYTVVAIMLAAFGVVLSRL